MAWMSSKRDSINEFFGMSENEPHEDPRIINSSLPTWASNQVPDDDEGAKARDEYYRLPDHNPERDISGKLTD